MVSNRRPPSLRSVGLLVIESSAFSSPFADVDHVVDGAAWLDYEVKKWLPGGDTIVLFPPDDALSDWARSVQGRLQYIGVRTSTRRGIRLDRLRTRMLWHLHSAHEQAARYRLDVVADRYHRIHVPITEVVSWERVAQGVAEYAALMAFPNTPEEPTLALEDEEPF